MITIGQPRRVQPLRVLDVADIGQACEPEGVIIGLHVLRSISAS